MPPAALDVYAYARQVLLPALGLRTRPFIIANASPGGTRSLAYKVTIERSPVLLLRLFGDRARALRNAAALRHVERHGLPAPTLEHADADRLNALLRSKHLPRYATAETWIEGVRALEAPDEAGVALMAAGLLAAFHAVERPRWGRPGGLPEIRPYASTVMGRAMGMLQDLVARAVLDEREFQEAAVRFRRWETMLARQRTFHLVHNDANRRNFILTPDKKLVAIDLRRVSYQPCAEEVVNAQYHFCRRDEALARRFVDAYLAAASPSCRRTWQRTEAFFRALNTLKRLHRRTGPDAASVVYPDEEAPAGPPGTDARAPLWKEALLTLPPPPRLWPEPGSAPPEDHST